jgi:hypothetical protein
MADHVAVIYALWIVFTHVYTRFEIAPRLRMWSEEPDSGKSVARKVARHLVLRPNEEALGTAAALRDYIADGPGTLVLDELDYSEPDALRSILKIWNLGHERGAKISLKVDGRRKLFDIHAPILGSGLGDFLEQTQQSRTFRLDMEQYTEETRPERRYDSRDVGDLDKVYAYLRHWARDVKLDLDPDTSGLIRRFADNARGLLAVADSCGLEWGLRAREALAAFAESSSRRTCSRPWCSIASCCGSTSPMRDGRNIGALAAGVTRTRSRSASRLRCCGASPTPFIRSRIGQRGRGPPASAPSRSTAGATLRPPWPGTRGPPGRLCG